MNNSMPIYKDPSRTVDERIADLLPRMSIEEKVAQMYVADRAPKSARLSPS